MGNPGICVLTAPTRRTVPSGATSTRRVKNGAAGVPTATQALPDHRSTVTAPSWVDRATSQGAYPGVPSRVSAWPVATASGSATSAHAEPSHRRTCPRPPLSWPAAHACAGPVAATDVSEPFQVAPGSAALVQRLPVIARTSGTPGISP